MTQEDEDVMFDIDDEDEIPELKEIKKIGKPKIYTSPKLMTNLVEERFIMMLNAQAKSEGRSRAMLIQAVMGRYLYDMQLLSGLKKAGDVVEITETISARSDGSNDALVVSIDGREYSLDSDVLRKLYLLTRR